MGLADIMGLLEQVEPPIRKIFIEVFRLIEEKMVTKAEFTELREAVKELAEAQKKTEERLNRLAQRVDELAEAQRKTEQRLNELAEAQRKTEERLNELAEAQRKTEERLNELAEAQRKTEERLNELAEAQRKTEEVVAKIVGEQRKIKEQLGGLSHTVGYVLEDRAYVKLPALIARDCGIKVEDLRRKYVEVSPGKYEEVNIIGHGFKDNKRVWILGECKSQLQKRHIREFERKLKRLEGLFPGDKVVVFVTYNTSPSVEECIRKKGYLLYYSYELEKV